MQPWTASKLFRYLIGWDNLSIGVWGRLGIFHRMFRCWRARQAHFRRFGTYDPIPGKDV